MTERGQQVPANTVAENGWILGTFQPAEVEHGNNGEKARCGDHLCIPDAGQHFGHPRSDLFALGFVGMDRVRMRA
ncbi:MAG: hypothetical protein DMG31_06260 [Acidobacteria bacterium]|nr:MAG: hypothetical protein DMG31_06260 [Acidobacteriota bacterium]